MKKNNNLILRLVSFTIIFIFLMGMLPTKNQSVEALNTENSDFASINQEPQNPPIYDVPKQPLSDSDAKAPVELAAWRNMRPTESYLFDISMLSNPDDIDCNSPDKLSKGWIVGDGGVILGYCNGVWDHALTTESIPTLLHGVVAITPQLAFAVGADGTILKYGWDNIAATYVWVKLPITVSNKRLNRIVVVEESEGNYLAWVTGEKDTILNRGTLIRGSITKTLDNDPYGHPKYTTNWVNVTGDYPTLPNTDLYFGLSALDKNNIWAVGGTSTTGGAIHWNGSTWSYFNVGDQLLYGVYFTAPNDGWATSAGGRIYHYNGTNWSLHSELTENILVGISFDGSDIGWAVGFDGTILKYERSIDEWKLFKDLKTDHFDFYAIDHASGKGWLLGPNFDKGVGGQILEYSEELWLAVTPPTDNQLNEISVLSDNNAWAVGVTDEYGATIIHWDGRHWQRWYQNDSPLPKTDLQTIKMISENNGWAAGDPLLTGAPAVFLHWDGRRWAPSRELAPLNIRTNDMDLVTLNPETDPEDFGWAVASNGNAVAKYEQNVGYWTANHTLYGLYYNLRGTDIVSDGGSNWDAWAVGRGLSPDDPYERFMHFENVPLIGNTWTSVDSPDATACGGDNGPLGTNLFGIEMFGFEPSLDGFTVGDYSGKAVLHRYIGGDWQSIMCQPDGPTNPSRFYSVDVVENSDIAWLGGYYTDGTRGKVAYLAYFDEIGFGWALNPLPLNGKNIKHRPISSVGFSSDTMGWAVGGDKEDASKISVIYQYPYPNYTLEINPQVQAIRPGNQAVYIASINPLTGFDENVDVNLSIVNLPPTISAGFSLDTINAGQTSTITLTTTGATPTGTYYLWLKGASTLISGEVHINVNRYEFLELIVTDNPIYSINPTHGPSGTIVTITGENFGEDPGLGNRSTPSNNVFIAGKQIPEASIISWSPSVITVNVPDDPILFNEGPVNDFVRVTANGSLSNQNFNFQLENHITDATIMETATGFEITVLGTTFRTDPGYLNRNSLFENVKFNGAQIALEDFISWDNNIIVFKTNAIGEVNTVKITSNGFESNEYTIGENNSNVFLPLIIR